MNKTIQCFIGALFVLGSSTVVAKPMPHTITIDNKAVVPVLKTQIIKRIEGQKPVRTVEATIFEVTNKGQDIVAREVILQDHEQNFSEKKLSIPVIQQGGVIVPTSKIEVRTTTKKDDNTVLETKNIDASGVALLKGQEPTQRNLKLEQITNHEMKEKVTHAVVKENGIQTKDVVIFSENP